MVNFAREFLPDLASAIEPMVSLTRKEITASENIKKQWGHKHDEAFAQVKQLLTSAPVLHFPDFSKHFVVHVDASESGAGAFLAQNHGEDLHIVAYFSKRFRLDNATIPQLRRNATVILTIQHWHPYLWGRHFVCVTGHAALHYLFQMQNSSNMLARWAIALQSFDFTLQHKPGRLHVIPDTLSGLFMFEKKENVLALTLAPVCRKIAAYAGIHTPIMRRPFELSSSNIGNLNPVSSDPELSRHPCVQSAAPASSQRSTPQSYALKNKKSTEDTSLICKLPTHRCPQNKPSSRCLTTSSTMALYIDRICLGTSGNAARFATKWWCRNPL